MDTYIRLGMSLSRRLLSSLALALSFLPFAILFVCRVLFIRSLARWQQVHSLEKKRNALWSPIEGEIWSPLSATERLSHGHATYKEAVHVPQ